LINLIEMSNSKVGTNEDNNVELPPDLKKSDEKTDEAYRKYFETKTPGKKAKYMEKVDSNKQPQQPSKEKSENNKKHEDRERD